MEVSVSLARTTLFLFLSSPPAAAGEFEVTAQVEVKY